MLHTYIFDDSIKSPTDHSTLLFARQQESHDVTEPIGPLSLHYEGISGLLKTQSKGVAKGSPGVPPFCKPFLTKQLRTGGENAMTFQFENVQTNEYPLFDTV